MPIVLANASPLIALGKLNRLEVLADLYHNVQMTSIVYDEVVTQGLARGAPDALTVRLFWQRYGWSMVEVSSAALDAYTPPVILDPGEHELLALAQTLPAPYCCRRCIGCSRQRPQRGGRDHRRVRSCRACQADGGRRSRG